MVKLVQPPAVSCYEKKRTYISTQDIVYLQGYGNYTYIMTRDGKKHLTSHTLAWFLPYLSAETFFRTHKSQIVNVYEIEVVRKNNKESELVLKDGTHLCVTRRRNSAFLEYYNDFKLFQNGTLLPL